MREHHTLTWTNERTPHSDLDETLELVPRDGGGERPVAVLLAHQVEEGGTNRDCLAVLQLLQADVGRLVVVSGLVPDSPPHVHWLELDAILVPGKILTR